MALPLKRKYYGMRAAAVQTLLDGGAAIALADRNPNRQKAGMAESPQHRPFLACPGGQNPRSSSGRQLPFFACPGGQKPAAGTASTGSTTHPASKRRLMGSSTLTNIFMMTCSNWSEVEKNKGCQIDTPCLSERTTLNTA